ncbi:MAG: biopolymer transporter ExbD [Elusimicrobia bacterium]|mgnify:CR=1 FL=1|jgi:biopolymer transport protein ExbD|nr:biopolymer transporter ExbD [Elusimicrobiota bacterium]MBK7208033.1 biopolymer transporter ExbD [Elusimicrobiota bacterium]MBK7544811.1 biopolymer transporter ExbD [Elusimicrobiota bacterium]MBK7574323.1 biopolymer transporter ExbD [Elusimicrobiota bacterium]MBK7688313.1 biopolymer transporter ExbD [Elusimicrobiota bacterium]
MKRSSIEKGEGEDISEVNVVPLADVSLVLLIILMLITPMVMQSMIKVFASRGAVAVEADRTVKEKPLFLEVRPEAYVLNTNPLTTELQLLANLRGELSRKDDRTVIVTAAKGVTHGRMVTALDIAKQAGAEKLSLVKKAAKS